MTTDAKQPQDTDPKPLDPAVLRAVWPRLRELHASPIATIGVFTLTPDEVATLVSMKPPDRPRFLGDGG